MESDMDVAELMPGEIASDHDRVKLFVIGPRTLVDIINGNMRLDDGALPADWRIGAACYDFARQAFILRIHSSEFPPVLSDGAEIPAEWPQFRTVNRRSILEKLEELKKWGDTEAAHGEADKLLLELINSPKVTELFEAIDKWYA